MYYLDIGNTNIKLALKEEGAWQLLMQNPHKSAAEVKKRIGNAPSSGCSVVPGLTSLFSGTRFITWKDFPRLQLNYDTPETLGMDRVLACTGAQRISGGAVCVVDAGTACTIDFMDAGKVFHGGVILPGLKLYEQSLKKFAPHLPVVDRIIPLVWPPKSTAEALQWGISGSFLDIVKMHIERMDHSFGRFTTWVTGGDAVFLMNNGINAQHFDFLVFEGLEEVV